jgi:hypothetical protein
MDYQARAEEFLRQRGIKFKASFTEYACHFDGDKEARDNFRCTFSRNGQRLIIPNFGQSINDSDGAGGKPPTAYTVLACITKSDPGDLENFCSEYGYDTNSRKAERTWRAVVKEWKKVRAFFTDSELEAMQEIQ